MANSPAVLITRPQGQADRLVKAVEAAGLRAEHQPLLTLRAIEVLPPEALQRVRDLDLFDHIIFISANAVRFGLARIDDYWPQLPVGLNWYAIGDTTASLLEERGLAPITPGSDMSSEGLLAAPELASVDYQRVLIVKGMGGRERLREVLAARGARVEELACYRRTSPELGDGELASRLSKWGVGVALISSGEGLQNMLGLLSEKETTKFRVMCLVVPSERVAQVARDAGFNHVIVAVNASDEAMLEALQQWRAGDE